MRAQSLSHSRNLALAFGTDDKRTFPRCPVTLQAQVYSKLGCFECELTELSETGATLSASNIDSGASLTICLKLGDISDVLQVECRVVRVNSGSVGVAFLDPTMEDRLRVLEFFIRARRFAMAKM
jgi:hypothetical protein